MRKFLTLFKKKAPQPVKNERRSFMSGVVIEFTEPKVRTIEPEKTVLAGLTQAEADTFDFNKRSEHIHNERKKMYESKLVFAQ